MKSRTRQAVAASVMLFAAACRDAITPPIDSTQLDVAAAKGGPPANTKRVSVLPATASIDVNATVQLTATAYANRNAVIPGATFAWASSAPGIATVSSGGLVTGVSPGTATISATYDGKTGTSTITVLAPPTPGDVVLYAAGDIAQCNNSNDEATAALLANTTGTIAVLGDNAYENGTIDEYNNCYGPSWGVYTSRTKPSIGNHEYNSGGSGYFTYFGSVAAPTAGYYSYNYGSWHVIVLNSNCSFVSCAVGSAQLQWLQSDLAANSQPCVLAYWHHPRFNSGSHHGNTTSVGPFWDALYAAGADVVLNGHEHLYERFAPQTPGQVASANGIRQFTVGTGGRGLYSFGTIQPNSEVRNSTTFGVLKLTLGSGSYSWQFLPIAGQTFTDTGSTNCH